MRPHPIPDGPEVPAIPPDELAPEPQLSSADRRAANLAAATPTGAWFTRLLEFLPNAFVHAHASELASLRADGATPAQAATYARAFLRAPSLV